MTDSTDFLTAARRAVREVMAKSRPSTLFEQAFFDIREKAKGLKRKWEEEAKGKLQAEVLRDLKGKGVQVLDAKLSLGRYRGSGFVTSFKLKVRANEAQAEQIAEYLRGRYSPKWKVKKVKDGVAELNVR